MGGKRMVRSRKYGQPVSLRLTPAMTREVEKLANESGIPVVYQIRLLLAKGIAVGKPGYPKQRLKAR